jgi:cob(I)alamin adenosyltransferase
MSFKIYTKTGDKGQTSLLGGTRVNKFDLRINAYGTVDELNSYLGLLRDLIQAENTQIKSEVYRDMLIQIQDRLFTIGSHLAADPEKNKMALPPMHNSDVTDLELAIDKINELVPPMKSFVLPGGHVLVSHAHVARCICRRAERIVLELNEQEKVEDFIIIYMNRLSDYIFMLSRGLAHELNAEEIPWVPKKD